MGVRVIMRAIQFTYLSSFIPLLTMSPVYLNAFGYSAGIDYFNNNFSLRSIVVNKRGVFNSPTVSNFLYALSLFFIHLASI